jgi:hypothetical protein
MPSSVLVRFIAPVLIAVSTAGLLGCPSPDAEGKYDRFLDDTKEPRDEFANMKLDMGSQLADVNGDFLFAIETSPFPGDYLQFIATTTLETTADGGTMDITFQPLSVDVDGMNVSPRLPVGELIVVTGVEVSASGSFRVESLGGMLTVVGEANPITGADIVADIGIEGFIQSTDIYCGNVFGMVYMPVMLMLDGSTFGAERVAATDPASLPTDILVKCPEGGGGSGSGGSGESPGSDEAGSTGG